MKKCDLCGNMGKAYRYARNDLMIKDVTDLGFKKIRKYNWVMPAFEIFEKFHWTRKAIICISCWPRELR